MSSQAIKDAVPLCHITLTIRKMQKLAGTKMPHYWNEGKRRTKADFFQVSLQMGAFILRCHNYALPANQLSFRQANTQGRKSGIPSWHLYLIQPHPSFLLS